MPDANGILTPEEIKLIVYNYAIEICQSNPIKEWNWTELIQRYIEAQHQADRERYEKEKAVAVREERERILEYLHIDLRREIHAKGEVVVIRLLPDDWQALSGDKEAK